MARTRRRVAMVKTRRTRQDDSLGSGQQRKGYRAGDGNNNEEDDLMKLKMQQGWLQGGDGHTKAAADNKENTPGMEPVSRRQKNSRSDKFLFRRPD